MIHTFTDKEPTLEEAQKLVGGYVTFLPLPPEMHDRMQVLVDEEGLLKDLPVNEEASNKFGQEIFGPVVVLEGDARWT